MTASQWIAWMFFGVVVPFGAAFLYGCWQRVP